MVFQVKTRIRRSLIIFTLLMGVVQTAGFLRNSFSQGTPAPPSSPPSAPKPQSSPPKPSLNPERTQQLGSSPVTSPSSSASARATAPTSKLNSLPSPAPSASSGAPSGPSATPTQAGNPSPSPSPSASASPTPVITLKNFPASAFEVRNPQPKEKITGMTLFPELLQHQYSIKDGKVIHQVELFGKFERAGWQLVAKTTKIPLSKDQRFKLKLAMSPLGSRIALSSVGPRGLIEKQLIEIVPKSGIQLGTQVPADLLWDQDTRKFRFQLGLGYTQLHILDSSDVYRRVGIFTQGGITLKGGVGWFFHPNWSVGLSSFFTLLPLQSSSQSKIRNLGVNGRLTWRLPWIKDPVALTLSGGWYYSTLFVSTNDIGFSNLSGPQLYPALRVRMPWGHSIGTYFKFSPIASSFSLLSLSNHEMATGLSYEIPTRSKVIRSITPGIDLSTMPVSLLDIRFRSTTASFGVTFGL